MGCWTFVQPRISTATRTINGKEIRPSYAGRKPSAATATGLGARAHNAEQAEFMEAAFRMSPPV
jgi:2-oxoglutarate dehydrogenase E1 component